MAKVIGERAALVAYSRLGVTSEIPRVIITCRTHYFYSGSEQRELLSTEKKPISFSKVPAFDVLHLSALDRSRIRKCVERRFDALKSAEILHFVESKYNLSELCSRPILLSLVCESYDQLSTLAIASTSADLYEAYVDSWLQRELLNGRLIVKPDDIKSFFEDLAEDLIKHDTQLVNVHVLKKHILRLLKIAGLKLDTWKEVERQLITSTFVSRSGDDSWQFVHRSFQEFFYARKFFRWESETGGEGRFPVVHIPIWQFIAEMGLQRWNESKARFWIRPRVMREKDPSLTQTTLRATAAYLLLKKSAISSRDLPLSDVMLDSVDLRDLDLKGCDLSCADLHGSNLEGTDLSSANLTSALLQGAQLRGTNLKNAKLTGCDISWADFFGANFGTPKSAAWVNTVAQLKTCLGYESAMFEDEVRSFLNST